MTDIGARRSPPVHLSRVLEPPGRHARAPTDSTAPGGRTPASEVAERTTRASFRLSADERRVSRRNARLRRQGNTGFRSRPVTFAGIPSARAVRPVRDTMGWLTRFLASKMEDPAKRQADFEAHMVETTAKCEEVCVRRNPSPPAIGPWGGVRPRTPPSVFPCPATPVAPCAVVADPLAPASSRPSSAGRKTGTSPPRRTGTGPRTRCRALCVRAMPSLERCARNEPRGSLPPCALRAATLPARSRTLPNSPPASSRRSRAARSRARATDRDAASPEALPPSRSLADPPEIARNRPPQYKFSQEPMLTNAPGRAQNW